MLRRCYRSSTYKNVFICEEWYDFKNFHEFVIDPKNGFTPGYHLDKDIICSSRNEKIYSPDTCIFIPQVLNQFLVDRCNGIERRFPSGVQTNENHKKNKIFANIQIFDDKVSLLSGDMNDKTNILRCFCYYKLAKEYFIHRIAELLYQEGFISSYIYHIILENYRITDTRINHEFTQEQCDQYIMNHINEYR